MRPMRIEGDRVRSPSIPSDFETGRICGGHSNYLPGNGIHRDVTRIPKRRQPLPVKPPGKTSDPFVRCTESGLPGYWPGTPSGRRRPDRRLHSCTSCIEKPRFSVPNQTWLIISSFRVASYGLRVARFVRRVTHCALRGAQHDSDLLAYFHSFSTY